MKRVPKFLRKQEPIWIKGYAVLMDGKGTEVSDRQACSLRADIRKDIIELDRPVEFQVRASGYFDVVFHEWFDGNPVFKFSWGKPMAFGSTFQLRIK